jgi:hypothetical protein
MRTVEAAHLQPPPMDEQMNLFVASSSHGAKETFAPAARSRHRRAARVVGDYEADRPRDLEVANLGQVQLRSKASLA